MPLRISLYFQGPHNLQGVPLRISMPYICKGCPLRFLLNSSHFARGVPQDSDGIDHICKGCPLGSRWNSIHFAIGGGMWGIKTNSKQRPCRNIIILWGLGFQVHISKPGRQDRHSKNIQAFCYGAGCLSLWCPKPWVFQWSLGPRMPPPSEDTHPDIYWCGLYYWWHRDLMT